MRNIQDAVAFCPPLIITTDEIHEMFDIVEKGLDQMEAWARKENAGPHDSTRAVIQAKLGARCDRRTRDAVHRRNDGIMETAKTSRPLIEVKEGSLTPLVSTSMDTQLLPFAMQDVPRYTSYPTAVQFQPDFPGATADHWLAALDRRCDPLGLCPYPLLPPALLVLRLPHLGAQLL